MKYNIVERLRDRCPPDVCFGKEAADEIERLRAALREVEPLIRGANFSKTRYPKAREALGE